MSRELDTPTVRDSPRPNSEREPGTIAPGTLLAGRYRVLELLGKGGMGVVYRAHDRSLELDIAIKVLHPDIADDPNKVAFFRNEVRVARMITHRNVCRLHDLEESEAGTFITMEYVAGEPLSKRLRRGAMPRDEGMRVLRDVAAGLAAAHASGVIHRDLKPSNVLLASDRAVVADFGIAGEGHVLASGPQDIAGTRGYMAPEQASGAALDARADVYAFGVLACVLLTGVMLAPDHTHPTEGAGGSAAALPVADIKPYLARLAGLGELIERCLARDPAERPADGNELAHRLAALTGSRRRPYLHVAAIALAIAVVATAAALWLSTGPAPSSPARVFVAAIDSSAVAANERWLGPALQRSIAHELIDAWGIDAEVGASVEPPRGAIAISGRIARDPSGRLRLTLAGDTTEGTGVRDLAIAATAQLVERRIAARDRHPTQADLREVGASDAEAWRLWRRAQREAWLQRWDRAYMLCQQASARDPRFPIAKLEAAFVHDSEDAAGDRDGAEARQLLAARPEVRPVWSLAERAARAVREGRQAEAAKLVEQARALALQPRERWYVEIRWAMLPYFTGNAAGAIPGLEQLTEKYPDDASAYKLLARFYLSSELPTARVLALRYARRAAELAPDDAAARADLAFALLLADKAGEARALAAELATMPPADKISARRRLFVLHMALGDPAEAEIDAQRDLTGIFDAPGFGKTELAMLDLYWGRFEVGLRELVASADVFDAGGHSESASTQRLTAAHLALQLGSRELAAELYARVAAAKTRFAPIASVLAPLAAGHLDEARAIAAQLPQDANRATAELAIAAASRDPRGVIAAYERRAKLSLAIEYDYDLADALERTGRLDDAAAAFTHLAEHPQAWTEPIASTRAWYRLGLLRERAGDAQGARAAFQAVIARWGAAKTPIFEVSEARKHLH